MSRPAFFPAFRNAEQRLVLQHCRLTPDRFVQNHEEMFMPKPSSGLLFPDAVSGKQMDTRCDLQGAGEPILGGLHPANEMRGLLVFFEGLGAGIDFVKVQTVLVLAVLNHIEQQTRSLVLH